MKRNKNRDEYLEEKFPYDDVSEEIFEDSILHEFEGVENFDDINKVLYQGPKTNVTVKQIMSYMNVEKKSEKFLYNDDTVVILIDYSKEIIEKWKNGVVLYCHGEKQYKIKNDMKNISLIDSMLFKAGCSGEVRVYVFWRDLEKNYRFINAFFVLSEEPYQIEEDGEFQWIFPLIGTFNKFDKPFAMDKKYSFETIIDNKKIETEKLYENLVDDSRVLIDVNLHGNFETVGHKLSYDGTPKEKDKTVKECATSYKRSRIVAENALIMADFKCEFNPEHATFLRKAINVPYTEAHHLVPLANSDSFDYSLDIEENVVSLCCNCHSQIHYGKNSDVIIKKLFSQRKELLRQAGIVLSEEKLLEMYGIK